jgi:hypothetical protein
MMRGHGWRGSFWALLVASLALSALMGCGSGGTHDFIIEGDQSFGGMPNPGSLARAIQQFGFPDQLYNPNPQTRYSCIARWEDDGITAQFIDWGGVGDASGPPCTPRSQMILTGVVLHGNWETDSGLRVGDSLERVNKLYHPGAKGTCAGGLWRRNLEARMLERVADPLGGPGSYLCTLGVMTSRSAVTGFVMSSRAASE